jgi:hypothetical protein
LDTPGDLNDDGLSNIITWIIRNNISHTNNAYSINKGSNWKLISASSSDEGNYSWTAFDDQSTIGLVKVADADGSPTEVSNDDQPELNVEPLVLDYGWTLNSYNL